MNYRVRPLTVISWSAERLHLLRYRNINDEERKDAGHFHVDEAIRGVILLIWYALLLAWLIGLAAAIYWQARQPDRYKSIEAAIGRALRLMVFGSGAVFCFAAPVMRTLNGADNGAVVILAFLVVGALLLLIGVFPFLRGNPRLLVQTIVASMYEFGGRAFLLLTLSPLLIPLGQLFVYLRDGVWHHLKLR